MTETTPLEAFIEKCSQLAITLKRKNDDYENSIFKTGVFGIMARIFDKMQRIQTIVSTGSISVDNESIEDTFHDLAGYGILGLLALEENSAFYENKLIVSLKLTYLIVFMPLIYLNLDNLPTKFRTFGMPPCFNHEFHLV